MHVTKQKQIILILALAFSLGMLRSFFVDDPEFTLIKKKKVLEEIKTFLIPDDLTGPMVVNLEFSKHYHEKGLAIFIDARDSEDYEVGHIEGAINIPYDYHEDHEELMNELDDADIYIIYCSGGECSLSFDLADYLYNEKLFDIVLIYEGGWPEWQDSNSP